VRIKNKGGNKMKLETYGKPIKYLLDKCKHEHLHEEKTKNWDEEWREMFKCTDCEDIAWKI